MSKLPDGRPNLARIIFWLLAVGSGINLLLPMMFPPSSRPIKFHPDPGLLTLVRTAQASLDLEYELYLQLALITPDRTLVAAEPLLLPEAADGLADITFEIDPSLPAVPPAVAQSLVEQATITGEFRPPNADTPGAYWIVPPTDDGSRLRLIEVEGGVVVVSEPALESAGG